MCVCWGGDCWWWWCVCVCVCVCVCERERERERESVCGGGGGGGWVCVWVWVGGWVDGCVCGCGCVCKCGRVEWDRHDTERSLNPTQPPLCTLPREVDTDMYCPLCGQAGLTLPLHDGSNNLCHQSRIFMRMLYPGMHVLGAYASAVGRDRSVHAK